VLAQPARQHQPLALLAQVIAQARPTQDNPLGNLHPQLEIAALALIVVAAEKLKTQALLRKPNFNRLLA